MESSFKQKIREIKYFLPGIIGIGFLVMIVINGARTYYNGKVELENSHNEMINNINKDLQILLSEEVRNMEVASELLLNDKEVLQLFSWQDRGMLADHLLPIYQSKLKPEFGVKQFQFHLPPATSFLRLHKVQKFGDDLSSFRKTVIGANDKVKIVSGLEVGVGGLGVRLVHPVMFEGKHIGSMEFGTDFNEILISIAKKNNVS